MSYTDYMKEIDGIVCRWLSSYVTTVLETEIIDKEAEIRRLQEADVELDNNTRQCQRQFIINKENTERFV